jgi:aconitate hydratase
MASGFAQGRNVLVRATRDQASGGGAPEVRAAVRSGTPQEVEYFRHGGMVEYVLRQLLAAEVVPA